VDGSVPVLDMESGGTSNDDKEAPQGSFHVFYSLI
jgi:hypothetical protein